MFGRAEPSTVVRGYEGTNAANADYAKLVALLASPPAPGTLRMITSHGNPFRAIAGPPHLDEGEAAVLKPAGAGLRGRGAHQARGLAGPRVRRGEAESHRARCSAGPRIGVAWPRRLSTRVLRREQGASRASSVRERARSRPRDRPQSALARDPRERRGTRQSRRSARTAPATRRRRDLARDELERLAHAKGRGAPCDAAPAGPRRAPARSTGARGSTSPGRSTCPARRAPSTGRRSSRPCPSRARRCACPGARREATGAAAGSPPAGGTS